MAKPWQTPAMGIYPTLEYIQVSKYLTGKTDDATEKGVGYKVVTDLDRNEAYTVYMDNFYTSPDLFMELKRTGLEACGTIRLNRTGVSITFKRIKLSAGNLNKKIIKVKYTVRLAGHLLCLKWKDMSMLSTFHDKHD